LAAFLIYNHKKANASRKKKNTLMVVNDYNGGFFGDADFTCLNVKLMQTANRS